MVENPTEVTLALQWLNPTDPPHVEFAEHLLVGVRGDYMFITVGQTVEPVADISGADHFQELVASGAFSIRPIARFAVPRSKFEAWAKLLNQVLTPNHEDASGHVSA